MIDGQQPRYTPGPWEALPHPSMTRGWIVRPVLIGPRVFTVPPSGPVVLTNEADAHLISAAPDLLESGVAVLDEFGDRNGDGDTLLDPQHDASLRRMQLAIAKARA